MVDNFALFVSQLMMIVVLWRCFNLPDSDSDAEPPRPAFRVKRPRGAKSGKDSTN
jgi:hypothetical protein